MNETEPKTLYAALQKAADEAEVVKGPSKLRTWLDKTKVFSRRNLPAARRGPACVDCGTRTMLVKIVNVTKPDGSLVPHLRRKALCGRCAGRFDTGRDTDEDRAVRYIKKAKNWADQSTKNPRHYPNTEQALPKADLF